MMSAGGQPSSTSTSTSTSRAAYIEEFNDDANTPIPGTRQTANVAANVALKRSKPEIRSPTVVDKVRNEASDTKTSSQPGASESRDKSSSRESKLKLRPLKIPPPPPAEKISGSPEKSVRSKSKSPEKPALRRKDPKGSNRENLRQECESRESAAKMRLTAEPVEKTTVPRHRRTDPPSPQATRGPPSAPAQDAPTAQPARPRPRPRPSVSQSYARPVSYHAGMMLPPPHIMYAQTQPQYIETRPPPVFAQPMSVQPVPYHPQPLPQPSASYLPTPLQTSAQRQTAYPFPPTTYESYTRPPLQHWPSDPYHVPLRRTSIHVVQPIVENPEFEPIYTTVSAPQPPPMYIRRESIRTSERPSPLTPPEEYVRRAPRIEDYYAMPPPTHKPVAVRSQPHQRPAIRHAATTSATHPSLHHRRNTRESVESHSTSRPSLTSRQPTSSSTETHRSKHKEPLPATEEKPTPGAPSLPTKQHRRPVSYYGPRELERQAEAYQAAQTGSHPPTPITTETIAQATRRRPKTTHSGESENGSRASSNSDVKKSKGSSSRTSSDKHRHNPGAGTAESRAKRSEARDEVTFRIGGGQSVQLDIKGQMRDGKTINFRPSRDGGSTEVSIGSRATSKMRDGRVRERRYSVVGGGAGGGGAKSVREIADGEVGRARSRSRVGTEAKEGERVETGLMERLRRMGPGRARREASVLSGRSGRSTVGEGQPF